MVEPSASMHPGALLIHGFTATPESLDSLTIPLKKGGFEIEAPLLPGHGTVHRDLSKTIWEDWYGAVANSFQRLQKRSDSISVAGLSLGGLLALMLASESPVKRLAVLSTPLFFRGFLARFLLPVIGRTPLRNLYPYQAKWIGSAINDPEGRKRFKSYPKMPIRAIMEIVKLQEAVLSRLSKITVPALIIHSPHDRTAPYQNMAALKEKLGSKIIKTVTLERSNHVVTMDYEKEVVAEEIVRFFGGDS